VRGYFHLVLAVGEFIVETRISQRYKDLTPEDRRTFNRWLAINTIVGSIFAAGLLAMALVGQNSAGHRNPVVAVDTASDMVAIGQIQK
jgi:hypothetical protein